jgi:hypothetical protein
VCPGGSRLLIEAGDPYDPQALTTFLGFAPEQASSADTAIAMARAGRTRAATLVATDTDRIGLGATAALVCDRPRRGEHRFHIATADAAGIAQYTGVLSKGRHAALFTAIPEERFRFDLSSTEPRARAS